MSGLCPVIMLGVLVAAMATAAPGAPAPGPPAPDSTAPVALTVEPSQIELLLAPGRTLEGSVVIANLGREALRLVVSVGPWPDAAGRAGDRDSSPWVVASPAAFTLKPGARRSVGYTLSVPRKVASGEHRAALLIQEYAEASSSPRAGRVVGGAVAPWGATVPAASGDAATAGQLVVVPAFVNIPAVRRSAEIAGLSLDISNLLPAGRRGLVLRVRGTGNAHARFCGSMRLTGPLPRQVVTEAVIGENLALPGQETGVPVPWEGDPLAPGRYSASVSLRFVPPGYVTDRDSFEEYAGKRELNRVLAFTVK